jgi:hypothetical protein
VAPTIRLINLSTLEFVQDFATARVTTRGSSQCDGELTGPPTLALRRAHHFAAEVRNLPPLPPIAGQLRGAHSEHLIGWPMTKPRFSSKALLMREYPFHRWTTGNPLLQSHVAVVPS